MTLKLIREPFNTVQMSSYQLIIATHLMWASYCETTLSKFGHIYQVVASSIISLCKETFHKITHYVKGEKKPNKQFSFSSLDLF